MNKTLCVLALVAVFAAGCAGQATQQSGASTDSAAADKAIAEAKAEMKKTDEMHYLWTSTVAALKGAEKAKAEGDFKKAIKLADTAANQAKTAQQQAKDNMNPTVYYNE